jgi:hypothetical protein
MFGRLTESAKAQSPYLVGCHEKRDYMVIRVRISLLLFVFFCKTIVFDCR